VCLRPDRAQALRRLEPVHAAHEDVHQDDVGETRLREVDRLLAARRDPDDLDPLVALQEHRQRVGEQRVVVDHEDADARLWTG